MYPLDEVVKQHLLAQLPEGSTPRFLLDRYWNQLVLYLLVAPVQWLHMIHLLATTHWDKYHCTTKALMVLYVAVCFIAWESIRIAAFHVLSRMSADDARQLVSQLSTFAQEGLAKAKPQYEQLVAKAKESVHKLIGGGAANGNASTASH